MKWKKHASRNFSVRFHARLEILKNDCNSGVRTCMLNRRQVRRSVLAKRMRPVASAPAIWASRAGAKAADDEFVLPKAGRWVGKVVSICMARKEVVVSSGCLQFERSIPSRSCVEYFKRGRSTLK